MAVRAVKLKFPVQETNHNTKREAPMRIDAGDPWAFTATTFPGSYKPHTRVLLYPLQ